jgi:serine protease SohB
MLVLFIFLIALLVSFIAITSKNKKKGALTIKNLNDKYTEHKEIILSQTLLKKDWKDYLKEKKQQLRKQKKDPRKNIYVIDFIGDIKASPVFELSEVITAILQVATPSDEVVLRLESGGGLVHSYGLATSQLMRLKTNRIPLTITIDKIAASGGYLMACVGNKILSAPFAIIGSIGVVMQLPNFNRLLKNNNIDFVQLTAGEYKRSVSVFGENTEAGKEKAKEELEDIHQLFKGIIHTHRPQVEIDQVATGEHWPGQRALHLKLVDDIQTSDDYLLDQSKKANLYEVSYTTKKSFLSKFMKM